MRKVVLFVAITAVIVGSALPVLAVSSDCEDCHKTITPLMVKDFNRGVMSKTMTCADCHGEEHTSADDVEKAKLPTIATCQACHEEQAEQYLAGKHAKGLLAIDVLPFTHGQPDAYIAGQKGCGGCHTLGMLDESARESEGRQCHKY
ncbi:MAG: cytochrome C, partial [Acidobacteria bacterium]